MIGKGKDYYQILGTDIKASPEDIEKAYKAKFTEMGLHPDKIKDPEVVRKFEEIREAYMTLRNPDRRAVYNKTFNKGMDVKEAQDVFHSFFHTNGTEGEVEKQFFKEHFPHIKESPYEVLGVQSTSSFDDIQKAYRTQVLKTHPASANHDPEMERKFIQITEAYKELVEREKQTKLNEQKKKKEKELNGVAQEVLEGFVKNVSHVVQAKEKPLKMDAKLPDAKKDSAKSKNQIGRVKNSRKKNSSQSSQSSDRQHDRNNSSSQVSSRDKDSDVHQDQGEMPLQVDQRALGSSFKNQRKGQKRVTIRRARRQSSSSFEQINDDKRQMKGRDRRDSTSSLSSRDRPMPNRKNRKDSTSTISSEERSNKDKGFCWRKQRRENCDRGHHHIKSSRGYKNNTCLRGGLSRVEMQDAKRKTRRRLSSSEARQKSYQARRKRQDREYCYRKPDYSTSSVSSEQRERDRRCTYKENDPSRSSSYSQRRKCARYSSEENREKKWQPKGESYRDKAQRRNKKNSDNYISNKQDRRMDNCERKRQKDRIESASDYISEDRSRSSSYENRNPLRNKKLDYRGDNQPRKNRQDKHQRNHQQRQTSKKYTSGNKQYARHHEKKLFDDARENEPRENVVKHMKEAGIDASVLTHEAPSQPKQQGSAQSSKAPKDADKKPELKAAPTKSTGDANKKAAEKPQPPIQHIPNAPPKSQDMKTHTTSENASVSPIDPSKKKEPVPEKSQPNPPPQLLQPIPLAKETKVEQPGHLPIPEVPKQAEVKLPAKKKQSDDEKPEILKPHE